MAKIRELKMKGKAKGQRNCMTDKRETRLNRKGNADMQVSARLKIRELPPAPGNIVPGRVPRHLHLPSP